jgi:hypothetical protein
MHETAQERLLPLIIALLRVTMSRAGALHMSKMPPVTPEQRATRDPDRIRTLRRNREFPSGRTTTPKITMATSSRTKPTKAISKTGEVLPRAAV